MVKKKWTNSAKPLQIAPENTGNRNSEAVKLKIFRGSMPPGPPRGYHLWRVFIQTPLHEILDLPQEIPLENAGNGICKTLDCKIFLGVAGACYFYQPSTSKLIENYKESQCLAMPNIKFILFPEALPPGPPTGLCPCTLLGASAAPRPLACLGAFGPHSCLLSKYHRLLQILFTALQRQIDSSWVYWTTLCQSSVDWGCRATLDCEFL